MNNSHIWEKSIGFLAWPLERMLEEQEVALRTQLSLIGKTSIGRLLGGERPLTSAREFRETVAFTDYETYSDSLGERRETGLAAPPSAWLRTSGRESGAPKWVPLSTPAAEQLGWSMLGLMIAAVASEVGDVRLPDELRLLNMTAPPPYLSGTAVIACAGLNVRPTSLFPRNDPAIDQLPFEERMAIGFREAAARKVDFTLSYSSLLAGVGSTFAREGAPSDLRDSAPQRRLMSRIARLGSRRHTGGPLPREIWQPRAIIAGGTDSELFRPQIREYWGCDPLDLFASTEGLFMGMQTWDRGTFTLIPHFNFFEFIPEHELEREDDDPDHVPETVLIEELTPEVVYELVVTSLLGGCFLRFRTGDLVRFVSYENRAAGVSLPQFELQGERTTLIEIGGFARLSERILEQGMQAAGVSSAAWAARKEIEAGQPIVRVWIEPGPLDGREGRDIEAALGEALRDLDSDWRDMERAGLHPLRVCMLRRGTFARLERDGGPSPFPRVNARDRAIRRLLAGEQASGTDPR